MILIRPAIEFLWATDEPLKVIERAGRICYKSEERITDESAQGFVKMLVRRGHLAMIEHASASYRIVCDRGISHEIVRHRLFSFAQESTRYCNYSGGLQFVLPPWLKDKVACGNVQVNAETGCLEYEDGSKIEFSDIDDQTATWLTACSQSEAHYQSLIEAKWTPQQARSVLNHSLKTEMVVTGNLRQWMGFFELRCAKAAHPQAQEIANMILDDIQQRIPIFVRE